MSNSPFVDQGLYPLVVGISNSPFTDQRAVAGAIIPPVNLNALDISYDTENSVLVLSDPFLLNPFISATTIVTGRTVLISDVNTNVLYGQAESIIGLSNTIFNPPPPSNHLIGNNPPSVLYPNQFSGLTSWFSGGSFRATAGGTIAKLSNNKLLTCTIWSNRGQPTQVKLNEFVLKLDSVSSSSGLGWTWDIIFTCRSINTQFTPLGTVATNSTRPHGGPTPHPGLRYRRHRQIDPGGALPAARLPRPGRRHLRHRPRRQRRLQPPGHGAPQGERNRRPPRHRGRTFETPARRRGRPGGRHRPGPDHRGSFCRAPPPVPPLCRCHDRNRRPAAGSCNEGNPQGS